MSTIRITRRNLLAGLVSLPLLSRAALGSSQSSPHIAEFVGAWLSPDWFFPGDRSYTEAEVRAVARRVLRDLSEGGINAVFLESFLRGYSLAPGVQTGRHSISQVGYVPGRSGLPLYPHLNWGYRVEVDTIVDPLEIFIEEGLKTGVEIHAWTHMFYWKMDNPSAMLPWHNAPSLWSELMVEYLRGQAAALGSKPTASLLAAAAELFTRTSDGRQLTTLLNEHGISGLGSPTGALLSRALRDGAAPPDFLLMANAHDPFPAARGKQLRPIYMNPAHPQVQAAILRMVDSFCKAHPNLAGIHLDHVRYPVDGQGLPPELQIKDGKYNFYNPADSTEMARYLACKEQLKIREAVLQDLVGKIRKQIPSRKKLSAAVLPSYYHERDNGRYRLGGYDFSSQDWVGWKVDFVVPMLYEMNPYFIRSLLEIVGEEQERRLGSRKITVYPGVSQMHVGRTGELATEGWVYFDLKQARDVKLDKKEQTEDMNFGPQ